MDHWIHPFIHSSIHPSPHCLNGPLAILQHSANRARREPPLAVRRQERRVEPRGQRRARLAAAVRPDGKILDLALAEKAEPRVAAAGEYFSARHRIAQKQLWRNALDGGIAVGKTVARPCRADCLDAPAFAAGSGGKHPDRHRGHHRAQRGGDVSWQAGNAGLSRRPARSADARPARGDKSRRGWRVDLSGVAQRPERRARGLVGGWRLAEFEFHRAGRRG